MSRRERQGAILRLVREREISTQAELVDALHAAGVEVVQTTISRDISELGLVKVRGSNGRLVYAQRGTVPHRDRLRELASSLRRWATGFEASGPICVVTTIEGYAEALAKEIDSAAHPDVLATLAGVDTILVVAREGVSGAQVRELLHSSILEGAA
jgi:transcriptional regulator of arginine metabolism